MRKELIDLLVLYLQDIATLSDCYVWFFSVSWDDPEVQDDSELRRILGCLELLATEAVEGMRPESEFRDVASSFVVGETRSVSEQLKNQIVLT